MFQDETARECRNSTLSRHASEVEQLIRARQASTASLLRSTENTSESACANAYLSNMMVLQPSPRHDSSRSGSRRAQPVSIMVTGRSIRSRCSNIFAKVSALLTSRGRASASNQAQKFSLRIDLFSGFQQFTNNGGPEMLLRDTAQKLDNIVRGTVRSTVIDRFDICVSLKNDLLDSIF